MWTNHAQIGWNWYFSAYQIRTAHQPKVFSVVNWNLNILGENPPNKARNGTGSVSNPGHMGGQRSHQVYYLVLYVCKECYCFSHRQESGKQEDLIKENGLLGTKARRKKLTAASNNKPRWATSLTEALKEICYFVTLKRYLWVKLCKHTNG